jgi:putative redox protein
MPDTLEYQTMQVTMQRVDDAMHFEAIGGDNVAVQIDASAAHGGHHQGARPMELLLMGLGGCSAIDVLMILQKARQPVQDLRITIKGKREKDAIPAPFKQIHLVFFFKGNLKAEKVENAIRLSMEKYCSATAMLQATATITWSYEIES